MLPDCQIVTDLCGDVGHLDILIEVIFEEGPSGLSGQV